MKKYFICDEIVVANHLFLISKLLVSGKIYLKLYNFELTIRLNYNYNLKYLLLLELPCLDQLCNKLLLVDAKPPR